MYDSEHCIYCGAKLTDVYCYNAEDFHLHYETYGQNCCARCNELITMTNRAFAEYLIDGRKDRIDRIIQDLVNFRQKLDDEEYIAYMEKLKIPTDGIGNENFQKIYAAKATSN